MSGGTDGDATPEATTGFAPGAQVRVRDEQWLVRKVVATRHDGWMVEVTGVSSFVRDTEAVDPPRSSHRYPALADTSFVMHAA